MKTRTIPPGSVSRPGKYDNICTRLVFLALPLLAIAACLPQMTGSITSAVSSTHTATLSASTPIASPHLTTASSEETFDRTLRPTPEPLDTPTESPQGTPVLNEIPSDLLQALLTDLSARLGVPIKEIAVIQAQSVEWNDSSLGCPQPGVNYLQVITPGFRVRLYSQGMVYDYHTGTRAGFILCGQVPASEPVPLMPVAPHGKP